MACDVNEHCSELKVLRVKYKIGAEQTHISKRNKGRNKVPGEECLYLFGE